MRPKESSARQRAYDFIQKKILSGAWAGGTVVSKVALFRAMGSSRTPIREAVRQLAGEGLLSQTSHGPMAVTNLTRVDIAELLAIHQQHHAILLPVESGRGDEAKAILADYIRASCQERMEASDHWERARPLNIRSVDPA